MSPIYWEILLLICGLLINIVVTFFMFGRYAQKVDAADKNASTAIEKSDEALGRVAYVEGRLNGRH